jgi:hypothetical protein
MVSLLQKWPLKTDHLNKHCLFTLRVSGVHSSDINLMKAESQFFQRDFRYCLLRKQHARKIWLRRAVVGEGKSNSYDPDFPRPERHNSINQWAGERKGSFLETKNKQTWIVNAKNNLNPLKIIGRRCIGKGKIPKQKVIKIGDRRQYQIRYADTWTIERERKKNLVNKLSPTPSYTLENQQT